MHGGPSLEDMLAELLEQEGPPEVPIPLADAEDLPAPVHSKKRKVRCTASFPPRQGEQRSFYSFLWLASFCGLVWLRGFGQLSSVIPGCLAVTCFDTSWVTPAEQTLASSRVGHVIVGGSTGWPLKRPKLTIFK